MSGEYGQMWHCDTCGVVRKSNKLPGSLMCTHWGGNCPGRAYPIEDGMLGHYGTTRDEEEMPYMRAGNEIWRSILDRLT